MFVILRDVQHFCWEVMDVFPLAESIFLEENPFRGSVKEPQNFIQIQTPYITWFHRILCERRRQEINSNVAELLTNSIHLLSNLIQKN